MTNNIKKIVCIALLLSFFSVAHAQTDSTAYKQITQVIEDVRTTYAPDKRSKLVEIAKADVKSNTYLIQTTEPEAKQVLQNKLKTIPAKVSITLFPDESVKDQPFGIVNLSVANLRTKPSHAAEMATQVLLGTQVDILQKKGGDYRVRTPEGYIAWVPTSSITPMTVKQIQRWKTNKKIIYIHEFGRSYSEADTKSQRVSDLVYGDILALQNEDQSFYKVAYPDQRIAYIPKEEAIDFAEWLNTRQATSDNIIKSAKTMLGLPYLWGGTSVKGVDCSGFTKTSFYMNGYIIPRDASQQVLHGEAVDILDEDGEFAPEKALKNLKPADLLFFAGSKNQTPNPRVTHVALYIGNGVFIHAAGTVRINSLLKEAENFDERQHRTIVAARRYIGSADKAIQKVNESAYYEQ